MDERTGTTAQKTKKQSTARTVPPPVPPPAPRTAPSIAPRIVLRAVTQSTHVSSACVSLPLLVYSHIRRTRPTFFTPRHPCRFYPRACPPIQLIENFRGTARRGFHRGLRHLFSALGREKLNVCQTNSARSTGKREPALFVSCGKAGIKKYRRTLSQIQRSLDSNEAAAEAGAVCILSLGHPVYRTGEKFGSLF